MWAADRPSVTDDRRHVEPDDEQAPPVATEGADDESALAELEDRLRRAMADFDNLQRRYQRELAREVQAERIRVITPWLRLVDDLERALEHTEQDRGPVAEGVRAILQNAQAVVEQLGFRRIDDFGQPFDPARHIAVGTVESDAPPGTVVAVVQPGYGTDEEVVRPAGVIVAKRRDSPN